MEFKKVVIVGGSRIPFARSMGKYLGIRPQDLMTEALNGLVSKFSLQEKEINEAALGTVIKHSRDWNFARECTLGSGLRPTTAAYGVTQACGSSLQAAIVIANKIALGQIESGIAGGVDTNSDLPVVFSQKFSHTMLKLSRAKTLSAKLGLIASLRPLDFKPEYPGVVEPRTGLSMGQSCELMAQRWHIPQNEQDVLALASHENAAKAIKAGLFDDLIVPMAGVKQDNNVRAGSTLEKMASLKPVFDRSEKGTLTAANSSALTDGAACVLLASEEWAQAQGLPILAYFTFSETAAVDYVSGEEGLLMAPVYAVSKMLARANMSLQDFAKYEIHEAFAAQVLCTLKAWEDETFNKEKLGRTTPLGSIDRSKLNVNGGSIALGHPFAATGARIISSLAKDLSGKPGEKGLISICTGGGMGVSAILEGAS